MVSKTKKNTIFYKNESEVDWEVTCVYTGIDSLKGSRVKKLEKYLDAKYFHLTYGDGVSDVNISDLVTFHKAHNLIGTVTAVHPPSRFGEMNIENDKVKYFEEKPQLTDGYVNGGYFVFKREFLDYLTTDDNCDLEFGALKELVVDNQLSAFKHEYFWQCMDNIRDRDYLNELIKTNKAPWLK